MTSRAETTGDLEHVDLYTDGGADPNPGSGGYGVVLLHEGRRRELSGAFRLTTNNRMELLAAIVGLEAIKRPCRVVVHSDSQYLVRAMEGRWTDAWEARGWQRKQGGPVPNTDLWKRLRDACRKHEVRFCWVPGHSGVTENERCDALAARARLAPDLPADEGYLEAAQAKARGEIASRPAAPASAADAPELQEGGPCRKCGTSLVRRVPRRKKSAGKLYVYEYYFYCVGCRTMYMVDAAKISPAELAQREREGERPGQRPAPPSAPRERGPARTSHHMRRAYELILSPRADTALFQEVEARLEHELGARPLRNLEGADCRIHEFQLEENPLALELHPERGVTLIVRGKRHRDFLRALVDRLHRARR